MHEMTVLDGILGEGNS